MNVYDFDKTIYNGDSTRDFYFYLLKKNPLIIKYMPATMIEAIRYMLGIVSKTKLKQTLYKFLNDFSSGEIENLVTDFWKANKSKIYDWYYKQKKDSDVIISASPDFILNHISKELGVKLICSKVDVKNGDYIGLNCFGDEKVKRFKEEFKDETIDEFYSDSWSDEPLARLAKSAYMVRRKGKVIPWNM